MATTSHVAAFAALAVAMLALHLPLDMWVQTEGQAAHKGDRVSWREVRATGLGIDKWVRVNGRGWVAVAGHVGTYTLGMAGGLGMVAVVLGLGLDPARLVAALALTAATHAWADRRHTLAWLARTLGKGEFWHREAPVPGAFWLDQAWHVGWLGVAALILA